MSRRWISSSAMGQRFLVFLIFLILSIFISSSLKVQLVVASSQIQINELLQKDNKFIEATRGMFYQNYIINFFIENVLQFGCYNSISSF